MAVVEVVVEGGTFWWVDGGLYCWCGMEGCGRRGNGIDECEALEMGFLLLSGVKVVFSDALCT